MAITTLTPKLHICFTNCGTMKVYDATGAESTENSGGWGATNILASDVDAAKITYTTPDGTVTTINVTTAVNDQVTVSGNFLLAEIEVTPTDGQYDFVYALAERDLSVIYRTSTYSLCVVRCCVDKLWAQVAANALGEDCKCTGTKTSALEKAEIAEGLYNAIVYGASCNGAAVKDTILAKLQRLCKLEKCNCK